MCVSLGGTIKKLAVHCFLMISMKLGAVPAPPERVCVMPALHVLLQREHRDELEKTKKNTVMSSRAVTRVGTAKFFRLSLLLSPRDKSSTIGHFWRASPTSFQFQSALAIHHASIIMQATAFTMQTRSTMAVRPARQSVVVKAAARPEVRPASLREIPGWWMPEFWHAQACPGRHRQQFGWHRVSIWAGVPGGAPLQ